MKAKFPQETARRLFMEQLPRAFWISLNEAELNGTTTGWIWKHSVRDRWLLEFCRDNIIAWKRRGGFDPEAQTLFIVPDDRLVPFRMPETDGEPRPGESLDVYESRSNWEFSRKLKIWCDLRRQDGYEIFTDKTAIRDARWAGLYLFTNLSSAQIAAQSDLSPLAADPAQIVRRAVQRFSRHIGLGTNRLANSRDCVLSPAKHFAA